MIGGINGSPPFNYSTDFFVHIRFKTDPEAIARCLPPPLSVADGGHGTLSVVRHLRSPMGPYTGVYLGVQATHRGQSVGYLITGLKTTFAGVVGGREIFGMPLQLGVARAEWNEELFEIRAGRSLDAPFCEVTLQLDKRMDFEPSDSMGTYAAPPRGYEGGSKRVLVGARMTTDLEQGELWSAKARLKIHGGTPRDDWSLIPVLGVESCSYMSGAKLVLPAGAIIDTWDAS